MTGDVTRVRELVVEMTSELRGFARKHAGATLLRFEADEDLAQGIVSEVLQAAQSFSYEDDSKARAWVFRIARRYLADRRRHWRALKRSSGKVLRLDWSRSDGQVSRHAPDPIASQTGPSTFALRREQLLVAAQTLALLLPRDRKLVSWESEGLEIAEQAERLDLSYEATVVARSRALERFRKTFELVRRGVDGGHR